MAKGEFAALKMIKKRKRERLHKKSWKRQHFKLKQKYDAVGCVPMAKALVLRSSRSSRSSPTAGSSSAWECSS